MDDAELRRESVKYASNAVSSASGLPSDVIPLAKRIYAFMANMEPERQTRGEWVRQVGKAREETGNE